jgi:tetraacyldisaccharide 4'-kinase
MRSPEFWWRPRPGAPARLLQPFGWLYGAITRLRMRSRGAKPGIPVICVGNFVAGGAGKTPTAIALAALLRSLGETPFMLTRGYGGALAGPIEVDRQRHGPDDVGDEALLLAAQARTIVARERALGASLAKRLGASVIVMDDGLQNPSLAKDLRIAVVDGASGVGNGLCVPAGPLRAPLAGQFAATDALLMIGDGAAGDAVALAAQMAGLELLRARLEPSREMASRLEGHPVIAVSGIGRPEKFAATLLAAKAKILSQRAFGDHHPYSADEVSSLIAEARRLGCLIATTEKDMTKLGPLWPETERERLVVVPVALVFEDPARLAGLVRSVLASAAAGAAQP